MTAKKVIRAQNISIENRVPTVYLVDSAGVFLPLQEDVFPDTDDFGRVFRNNAVMSAMGISQIAAIMGMCVAGGGYLPVMCDHVLMTDGSGLFLAGPALVQAAIGQKYSAEELGGAEMHAAISGTVDYREPNDEVCIARIRAIVEKWGYRRQSPWDRKKPEEPSLAAEEIYGIYDSSPGRPYDMMPQVTAAALVSENKVLAHPASVDSITTSGNKEDYVSMGMGAAIKLKKIVENTRNTLAIEAMAAAQALDLLAPLKSSKPLQRAHAAIRAVSNSLERDRVMYQDFARIAEVIASGKVAEALR